MTEEYNGYTLTIEQDEYPANPRTEWDNLSTFALFHNRYVLANETDYRTEDFGGWDELALQAIKDGAAAVVPVYGYDHGLLSISTKVEQGWWHYAWDGGQLGIAFITREQARKEYGWKYITQKRINKLWEALRAEVETYNQYLTGDVWTYLVEAPDGELVDSCSGYYGYEYALADAKEAADAHSKQLSAEPV